MPTPPHGGFPARPVAYPVARPPDRPYRGHVLTPPDGLPEAALTRALERWWGLAAASMTYRPVGWGSHHWEVTDTEIGRAHV